MSPLLAWLQESKTYELQGPGVVQSVGAGQGAGARTSKHIFKQRERCDLLLLPDASSSRSFWSLAMTACTWNDIIQMLILVCCLLHILLTTRAVL